MRAKTINEIQKFERNIDPLNSMGIGKVAEVKKMLDAVYKTREDIYDLYQYNIKSLNHIEIFYSDFYKDDIRKGIKPEQYNNVWIIKYVEKDRYFMEENSYEMGIGTSYNWDINEIKFRMDVMNPERMKFENTFVCKLSQQNKLNEERAKIIVDALNKQYGKISGFEFIDKINGK